MAIQRTLSIIKPDAVAKNVIGQIIARFEGAGLKVIAGRLVHLSAAEAGQFYAVHKERPFFKDLVEFMTSGPVFVQVLEGEDAINRVREINGNTNPAEAGEGTIRKLYGIDNSLNSVHASDSLDSAEREIKLWF